MAAPDELALEEGGKHHIGRKTPRKAKITEPDIRDELGNAILLVILYMVQGIPLGLSMGSMPFLMRSTMSYTKIGIFTLAAYPYSFKLLWSPIVDTIYSKSLGRRKSWILPLQSIAAVIMLSSGGWIETRMKASDAVSVTAIFFILVLIAATQDIAVDGWALTLLSRSNVGYAATCQTVGMNIGYFTSFTVFLALSDGEFCSSYFGTPDGTPLITLSGYLRLWGWMYLVVTAAVAFFKPEHDRSRESIKDGVSKSTRNRGNRMNSHHGIDVGVGDDGDDVHANPNLTTVGITPARRRSRRLAALSLSNSNTSNGKHITISPVTKDGLMEKTRHRYDTNSNSPHNRQCLEDGHSVVQAIDFDGKSDTKVGEELITAYAQLWRVVNLPTVRLLAVVLMVARLGMLAVESAAPLKLLEKGVSKEALAGLVLVEFPIELLSAVIAGRWAASSHPLRPYFSGYQLRLLLAGATALAVYYFPPGAASITDAPRAFGVLAVLGVCTSFASTLMFTALGDFFNRISDPTMGGAYLTLLNTLANVGVVVPKLAVFASIDFLTVRKCSIDSPNAVCGPASAGGAADGPCTDAGGVCLIQRDGFYVLALGSVVVGVVLGVWIKRVLKKLENAAPEDWRARH